MVDPDGGDTKPPLGSKKRRSEIVIADAAARTRNQNRQKQAAQLSQQIKDEQTRLLGGVGAIVGLVAGGKVALAGEGLSSLAGASSFFSGGADGVTQLSTTGEINPIQNISAQARAGISEFFF